MVISCRALGRNLESAIITEAIRRAWVNAAPELVQFAFRPGPRNEPARKFLREYTGLDVAEDGAQVRWDAACDCRAASGLPGDVCRRGRRVTPAEVERAVKGVLETVLRRSVRSDENVLRAETSEWDSLCHVELVFTVESTPGIQFEADELPELDSSQALIQRALHHLAIG